ncbi:DUF4974 domain-containing protein [Sabulilitoribacter arenilitoris]|uniref:DUF4974 domain-containing protein n=1 Tax=Wocania arenilitoris TaxID=2044858 RepID=A0AAE3JL84_9FLAO|nr:FecR domain-containing protein [Wocania arenilitoris]MCF7567984.1 DUF4974 domain-containing protein [Wocania arenilitoris]
MTQKELDKIIEKYLQEKATQEEINHIENLEQFAKNKIKDKVFRSKIEKEEIKDAIFRKVQKNVQQKTNYRAWLRVAASIAILISIGIGYYFNSVNENAIETQTIAYITKETTLGQKSIITLPDGSTVKLNSGSKITFPEKFSDSIRDISLEGEAFFEVVKNEHKPFVITSNKLTTTVLGTTFNVEAYTDKTDVKVTLATGKVSIYAEGEKAILIPSEQIVFNKEDKKIIKKKVDVQRYLEWKDGILRFENATLEKAVDKIEKWYNVTIEFENKNLSKCTFTGVFKNERLQTILEHLVFVKQNVKYEFVSERKIIIRGRCTN